MTEKKQSLLGSVEQCLAKSGHKQVADWMDMPPHVRLDLAENLRRYRAIFETPKDELFADLREVNPRTGERLIEHASELLGFHTNYVAGSVQDFDILIESANLAVAVCPLSLTADPYLIHDKPDMQNIRKNRYYGLPESIVRAYYTEFGGFELPFSLSCEGAQTGLPHGGSFVWITIDLILKRYKLKKRGLERIAELMPDIVPEDPKGRWREFVALLETYNLCEDPKNAFAIMFKTKQKFKQFYVLKAGDVENIRVLKDPIDTIDKWCAYMLSGQPADDFEIERYCE